MKPYSKDLRLKVLDAVDRGMPRKEVAQVFGISVPSIKRWIKRRRETGNVQPLPIPGPPATKGAVLDRQSFKGNSVSFDTSHLPDQTVRLIVKPRKGKPIDIGEVMIIH